MSPDTHGRHSELTRAACTFPEARTDVDGHMHASDTHTNPHVHARTHTRPCTQTHTSTGCRHTCRSRTPTRTRTRVCNKHAQVHAYTLQVGMGTRIHRRMRIWIHTNTHRYAGVRPTHADTHRASCVEALNTHVRAHRHAETRMRACTRQTYIYHRCTNTCLGTVRGHTQTSADPRPHGHTLVGAGPRLPAHFRAAHRPHCPAGPTPPFISLWTVASRLD